ncbi:MAG: ribonuclease P protein component [Bacteroidales bacterium]|nr:ribonuclease P protein component [Bacteroidales bacterium]
MKHLSRKYRFAKHEKLCSEKQISELFEKGRWEQAGRLKLRYLIKASAQPALPNVLISVPKKQIRRAVGRNRIKRQIREAYRLNKWILLEKLEIFPCELYMAIIFSGESGIPYLEIEEDLKKLLGILGRKVGAK